MFEREILNGDGHISHHISYLNFVSAESKTNSKYYELEKIIERKIPRHLIPIRIALSAATTKSKINAFHFRIHDEVIKNPTVFGISSTDTKFKYGIYASKTIETIGNSSPYRVGYSSNYFFSNINNVNKIKSIKILEDFIHTSCSFGVFGCIHDENGKIIDNQLHIELFPCITNIPKNRSLYATAEHRDILSNTLIDKYGVSRNEISKSLVQEFDQRNPYHIKIRLDNNEITSIKWYRQYTNIC